MKIKSILLIIMISIASILKSQYTTTIQITKDAALIYCGSPDRLYYQTTNYGSYAYMRGYEGTRSGYPDKRKSLIDIDLSSLPANAKVTSAKLYLYAYGDHISNVTENSTSTYKPNKCYLSRVISSWSESTVTWNSAPAITTMNQVLIPNSQTVDQDYEVDITQLVQDHQIYPESSFGLMLRLEEETPYRHMWFWSSDATDSNKKPKIVITYEIVTDFSETEGFESALTTWGDVDGDDLDWTRKTGATSSSNTGPSSALVGSYYAYIEASTSGVGFPNKKAILISPAYFLNGIEDGSISFGYHMYGTTVGSLSLKITSDGGQTWTNIWSKSGNQGNAWFTKLIDLSSYAGKIVLFRFVGITGSNYSSDIALDQIIVNGGENSTTLSTSQNFVSTTIPTTEGGTRGPSMQSVDYFDGLGRLKQTVNVHASPDGRDLVTPVAYNDFGLIERDYLPYESNDSKYGSFRDLVWDATDNAQEDFYQNHFGLGSANPYAYSRTVYEESPLNRVLKQGRPGIKSQPVEEPGISTDYAKEITYGSNIVNNVRCYTVNMSTGVIVNSPTFYAANELFKTTSFDEENKKSEEFTNKLGQVILKRNYYGATAYSTYYIYDDFGLLRYVLSPQMNPDTGGPIGDELNQWCYQYKYDERKRMIEKKVPGADWVYMVYDERDRLVLTQDGNLRTAGDWLYTQYDILNRPVVTGLLYTSYTTQSSMRAAMEGYYSGTGNDLYETYTSSGYGYNNESYPGTGASVQIYTVTYYDSYSFRDNLAGFSNMGKDVEDNVDTYLDEDSSPQNGYFDAIKGLATGQKILVLDGLNTNWIYSVNYYDDKYRMIQQQQKTFPEGTSMISSRYDFIGNVMETNEKHVVEGIKNEINLAFDYDHAGRLINTFLTVNTEDPVLLSRNEYNALGELEQKNLHGTGPYYSSFQQNVDYVYDIRGWLTYINDPNTVATTSDMFGMRILYDESDNNIGNSLLHNGNISATIWANQNESLVQSYKYSYDDLSRLTSTDYWSKTSSWSNTSKFETSYTYDRNGNILTLNRNNSVGTLVDQLTYTYNGNLLSNVSDAQSTVYYGDLNIFSSGNVYDLNGNLINHSDKGIYIDYNYLNLPKKIYVGTYPGADNISYIYDATGVKWLKKSEMSYSVKQTMYAGSFVYEDASGSNYYTLDYILDAEGVVEMNGSTVNDYTYHLKDHLGNVRVVFNDEGTVLQKTSYFPFGLAFAAMGGDNKYLYNGKELQDDQLGGVNLDWYDFNFRMYDPALGRFTCLDPIAEKFYHVTPYNYAENRPISGIDLWGLQYLDHNKARIIAQHGSVKVKKANLHNVTRNRINRLNENPNYWKPGEIGYNTTIAKFEARSILSSGDRQRASMDNTYGATDPSYNPTQSYTERGSKKNGTPDMRQKQRPLVSGPGSSAKGLAGAALAINAFNFGLEFAGGMLVAHDIKLIEDHSSAEVLGKALGDLNEAIGAGMIPKDYMNTGSLTDILNVVLQGENTTNNQDIMNIGVSILQDISGNYDEERIKRQ